MSKIKKRNEQTESKIKTRKSERVSTNTLVPIFSFEFMIDSKHCISCCDDTDLIALLKKLRKLSKMSWGEIQSSHRHGLGCEIINKKSINESIPKNLQRDDINFLSIRFNGRKPMIGFREDRIFNILWIDYDYSVYKHG